MTPGTRRKICTLPCTRGFTMIEILVVITILGIILAIAIPSIRNWRPSLDAKQTAVTVVNLLREARSRAVATNFQSKIEVDLPNRQYRMQSGSQAYNTPVAGWTSVPGYDWTTISNGVTMTSGVACNSAASVRIQFNANGSAGLETPWATATTAPVTVCFQGGGSAKTYRIVVSSVGFISLQ